MTLGEVIKARRHELAVTRDELAQRVGCNYCTIRDTENGRHSPRAWVLRGIAAALELEITDLTPLWSDPWEAE